MTSGDITKTWLLLKKSKLETTQSFYISVSARNQHFCISFNTLMLLRYFLFQLKSVVKDWSETFRKIPMKNTRIESVFSKVRGPVRTRKPFLFTSFAEQFQIIFSFHCWNCHVFDPVETIFTKNNYRKKSSFPRT